MDKPELVPDFGEPWEFKKWYLFYHISPAGENTPTAYEAQHRTLACVNALAGCRPEKLQGFVEAVEKATVLIPRIFRKLDSIPYGEEYCIYRDSFHAEIYKLTDALAAFRGSAK